MRLVEGIKNKLMNDLSGVEVYFDEPMGQYLYTKLGGPADVFAFPKTIEEVKKVVRASKAHNLPLTLLGNGSNLIIRDGGIRGIVMSLSHLNTITSDGEDIIASSGATIIDVSYYALELSLSGLEFACGIPGTVGGAVFMNAGAYGGEVKDCLHSVTVMDTSGEVYDVEASKLELGYRTSNVAEKNWIVLSARFTLKKVTLMDIKAKMDDLTERRTSKQPLEYPSCGSVFKRPPGHFAGQLIQESGLQGKGIGGAEVSTKHAGFIVNKNHATASDYIAVIEMVQQTVKTKFGITLEREVRIIGEEA
ncbi:UDP-N-acetylenolpyruvoylglucosamine reductase [Halolactibacillus alkaliphilus]|uniref:UDP-N-acetylenolpyruvoylglucosamine reductase n=1 Tax=Halolactibacillus alkaliphilus TaxID=442899 RepID=A0A511X0W2_9BACI|nr:UDP-N-acetylmuramate dehydrogenase [Halolactibacillus alkaliphilus]GEN56588.1 UDP-N-acetylenolpyruvoylglucosamine reductase [Halolactibacillus alkaliphilus]GGN69663.1 UDP-N-acetylenolpyruvoylglucosamine reductase [Halolactibacillus alkaliphilus]SFO76437.1 UDP-N-acetylmuramate dehydrogenase [Halolactibacillus alkaliphilus]